MFTQPTNMNNKQKTKENKSRNINKDDDLFLSSQIGGWVYILKSKKDSKLYLGSTNNLRKRFQEHNLGKVFSTKNRIPFDLVYSEIYKSEKDARMREHNLKLRRQAYTQLKRRIQDSLK